jgi:hypothetical protein
MRRDAWKLKNKEIEKLSEPGRYADGNCLYLRVSDSRTKSWVLIWKRDGRRREMGLGSYPIVTLSEAREQAGECLKLLSQGVDPLDRRNAQKAAKRSEAAKAKTFQECAFESLLFYKCLYNAYGRHMKSKVA